MRLNGHYPVISLEVRFCGLGFDTMVARFLPGRWLSEKIVLKDGRLITADYVLPKPEHNRCYHTPRLLFPSFDFRRTTITETTCCAALHSPSARVSCPTMKPGGDRIAGPTLGVVGNGSSRLTACLMTGFHSHVLFRLMPRKPSHGKNSIQLESGTADLRVDSN